jgi:subtilisin family serine protease
MKRRSILNRLLIALLAPLVLASCSLLESESQGDELAPPADPPKPMLLASPSPPDLGTGGAEAVETGLEPTPDIVTPLGTEPAASGFDLSPPPSLEELLERYPQLADLLENMDLTDQAQLDRAYGQMLMLYENEGIEGLHQFMRQSGMLEALNLDSIYVDFVIAHEEGGLEGARQLALERQLLTSDNTLRLVLILDTTNTSLVEPQLTAAGARILRSHENEMEIGLPLSLLLELTTSEEALAQLVQLAHLEHVVSVRAPDYAPANPGPQSRQNQSPNQVEGVDITSASAWHAAGLSGAGIKIGIIDPQGFGRYQDLTGASLPPADRLFISPYYDPLFLNQDTGPHGTASAEIIHAMAPGAALYLAYTAGSYQALGQTVDWLLDNEVHIISYSAGSLVGAMDGSGKRAALVQKAAEQGVLWVNASGNHAQAHLNLIFSDQDGDGWHEFAGGDETLPFSLLADQPFITVGLTWNDQWGGADQDYDLYILRRTAAPGNDYEIVASQRNFQGGRSADEPYELLVAAMEQGVQYLLALRGNDPDYAGRLNLLGHGLLLAYSMPAGSLSTPADASQAFSVGATRWNDDVLEPYSSQGPTSDGRGKPEITGPTGVTSAAYGGPYYGTSSSAPHIAGAAALVWEAFPSTSATEVRDYLLGSALDLQTPGFDNATGVGRLNLPPPPQAEPLPDSSPPLVNLYHVWQEHNVSLDGRKGMKIHLSFDATNLAGSTGHIIARFSRREPGSDSSLPLADLNQSYRAADGQIAVSAPFTPRHAATFYLDEALFLPYEELDLGPGDYSLEFEAQILDPAQNTVLARSGPVRFTYSQNNPARASAAISDISFSHDVVRDDQPGLEIRFSFDVANFAGSRGQVAAYFYFDGPANRPLRDFNGRYQSSTGTVAAARSFTTKDAQQTFDDFYLFIPYDELHLSQGQHNLKFYLAIQEPAADALLTSSDWVYFWHAQPR